MTEIETIIFQAQEMAHERGMILNCLILPYQMWEVGFFDATKWNKPQYLYKSCNLTDAVKGAFNIWKKQINNEKIDVTCGATI
jgi:hypothetical protein